MPTPAKPTGGLPLREDGPVDRAARPGQGLGLCLSGGGYRAMLFHLGALRRLNELGLLRRLRRVASVSAGSLVAGLLGLQWRHLAFDRQGVATAFEPLIERPLWRLAGRTVDLVAVAGGLLRRGGPADHLAAAWRQHLFGDATLQDLPTTPRIVICATNLQSNALFRFSKPYLRDWRVGEIPAPRVELAVAVAASSAFPPVLSPLRLRVDPADFTPGSGADLQREPYTRDVHLTDGGVYDNLALETVWKRCRQILVSDGGARVRPAGCPATDWARHTWRAMELAVGQSRSLRRRQLVAALRAGQGKPLNRLGPGERHGAYWGLDTDLGALSHAAPALTCPHRVALALAATPTVLRPFSLGRREQLVNYGYAVCDAAVRTFYLPDAPCPRGFPFAVPMHQAVPW